MLPRRSRLRSSSQFTATTRGGRRASAGVLVVHLRVPHADPEGPPTDSPATVGLTVGRGVGNSVVRHRTSRRLRHLAGARLADLPRGATLVIRALPGAGDASSAALGRDLDAALARVLGPGAR